jgi:hypothetical protein
MRRIVAVVAAVQFVAACDRIVDLTPTHDARPILDGQPLVDAFDADAGLDAGPEDGAIDGAVILDGGSVLADDLAMAGADQNAQR